jgi:hypothetical protein
MFGVFSVGFLPISIRLQIRRILRLRLARKDSHDSRRASSRAKFAKGRGPAGHPRICPHLDLGDWASAAPADEMTGIICERMNERVRTYHHGCETIHSLIVPIAFPRARDGLHSPQFSNNHALILSNLAELSRELAESSSNEISVKTASKDPRWLH